MRAFVLPIDATGARLHLHLSYEQFFGSYDPYRDGHVYIATYSFEHRHFKFWSRLQPLSTLFIDQKYAEAAASFLRRFPLFEVRTVPRLHTKAVFFSESGRLLLGSENLYGPTSDFFEAMVELTVPEHQRDVIVQRVFRDLGGRVVTPKFGMFDIRLHTDSGLYARPYLPCHKEIDFWSLVSRAFVKTARGYKPQTQTMPTYVYNILEYEIDGIVYHLAFDRGYCYCGDLDVDAYQWIVENCTITSEDDRPWASADSLGESSPHKDFFMKFHPVASRATARRSIFLGPVENPDRHSSMLQTAPRHDIGAIRIHHPEDK